MPRETLGQPVVDDALVFDAHGWLPPLRSGYPHCAVNSVATIDTDVIRRVAVSAPGGMPSTAELADLVGDARVVLIGESSHGTREFYDARARITQWLIAERGFCDRRSHYFHARAADQFDAIIHIDRTEALEPLEPSSQWTAGELPESYPSGL
jgi:hypothetical protein